MPVGPIEEVLLRCRYSSFYSDEASIVDLFNEAAALRDMVPSAYAVLKIMAGYYNPTRARMVGTVDAEREILRSLGTLIDQPMSTRHVLSRFVAMAFYSQMASHLAESRIDDFRVEAINYVDQALALLESIYSRDEDRQFERVHLLRNRARLVKDAAGSVMWYDRAISAWSEYIAGVHLRASNRFVAACKIHLKMCRLERESLLGGATDAIVKDILETVTVFSRSHPLSYWVGMRCVAKEKDSPRSR